MTRAMVSAKLPPAPFLAALAAIALFSLMDAVMKGLVLAMGAYNAVLWRNIAGAVIGGLLFVAVRAPLPGRTAMRVHILRSLLVALMSLAFFWSLAFLPLAEAIGLSFIAPVIALSLAAMLLGERIGRGAVLASLLGLAGTGVILSGRMVGSYQPAALWGAGAVLLSAVLFAWNLILARQQAQLARPVEIAFFQSALTALFLLPAAPFWLRVPAMAQWGALLAAALLALASLLLLSWAYARAEAQKLIPVEYSAFVWAVLFGWLFFGERVSLLVLAGTVLIAGGSLIAARGGRRSGITDVKHVETTAL